MTKAQILAEAAKQLHSYRCGSRIPANRDHDPNDEGEDVKPCWRCRNDVAECYGPILTAYWDMVPTDGLRREIDRMVTEAFQPPSIDI